jgi:hypothetical protein
MITGTERKAKGAVRLNEHVEHDCGLKFLQQRLPSSEGIRQPGVAAVSPGVAVAEDEYSGGGYSRPTPICPTWGRPPWQ